jgi:cytochrome P450
MRNTQIFARPSRTAPPGPAGYPLVGILPRMLKNPLETLTSAARQYGGVVRLGAYRWGLQVVLISHPASLKHVLQEHYQTYKRGFNAASAGLLIGRGLPMNDGESWLQQRRRMQPVFQAKPAAEFAPTMITKTTAMLDSWQAPASSGDVLNIMSEISRLARDIIIKTMFGLDMIIDQVESLQIEQALSVAVEYINQLLVTPPLPLWVPTPRNLAFRQAIQTFDRPVYRIIEQRRRTASTANDLLSILLRACDAETGCGMSDRQLRDEVMTIFLAGHESSATTLSWACYLLSQHPDAEQRLHAEVDQVLGGHAPTADDLPRLVYTRMVLCEALRLYPPGWLFSRSPLADDQIDGYSIPRGTLVLYSPYVTHRLPELWNNPDAFVPERFAPERLAALLRHTYIPFGAGPRQCIGNHFALMEAQLILAMIAQRYRLRLAPGAHVEVQPALTLRPRYGLHMTLQRRF